MNENTVKKNTSLALLGGFLSLLTGIAGTLTAVLGALLASLNNMHPTPSGNMLYLDAAEQHRWIGNATMALVAAAAVFLVCLILGMIVTGRTEHTEDGEIYLRPFDRIWSEVEFILCIGFFGSIVALADPIFEITQHQSFMKFYTPAASNSFLYSNVPNEVIGALCVVGIFICVLLGNAFLLSMVKKLKAHKFWYKSLLGGIFLYIWRLFKTSTKTTLKITLGLCILAVLAAVWVPLPFILAGILIGVPKVCKKFEGIQKGVEEVKNGNLDYKIPVEADVTDVSGDLDRLAEDINAISSATGIAVQNELKNQRMKTELISNVSHDIKTPLTSMISYLDLLKKEGLDSVNAQEYLRIIDEKTQRLKVLTEDLFEAAKASSGEIRCEMGEIDLGELVQQSVGEMSERLDEKRLDVIVTNKCDTGMVQADGQLMWRVVENLLSNVSKYALEGSRVYINMSDVDEPEPCVLLEMKNISKDALNIPADELMERFKRGDESRNTEGSGLGLAIAQDLTVLMGGSMELAIDGDLFKAEVRMKRA